MKYKVNILTQETFVTYRYLQIYLNMSDEHSYLSLKI